MFISDENCVMILERIPCTCYFWPFTSSFPVKFGEHVCDWNEQCDEFRNLRIPCSCLFWLYTCSFFLLNSVSMFATGMKVNGWVYIDQANLTSA